MNISDVPGKKDFENEGLVVLFPGQARTLHVKSKDIPADMPMTSDKFTVIRPVLNLKLEDDTQPNQSVLVFDPPIVIRVRFNSSDLKEVDDNKDLLKLGIWDEKSWTVIDPVIHHFRIEDWNESAKVGWAVVDISRWEDPTIAIGK